MYDEIERVEGFDEFRGIKPTKILIFCIFLSGKVLFLPKIPLDDFLLKGIMLI